MDETMMMHGQHYAGQDVTGWIATEKLDGVRAYWDGATMWTRGGKAISIPDAWRENLPAGVHLDGELFAGYGQRQIAVNAARYGRWDDAVRFVAFDAPTENKETVSRYVNGDWLLRDLRNDGEYTCRAFVALQVWNRKLHGNIELVRVKIASVHEAIRWMQSIKANGGEGLMLRHPDLEYMPGRTHLMLKLK